MAIEQPPLYLPLQRSEKVATGRTTMQDAIAIEEVMAVKGCNQNQKTMFPLWRGCTGLLTGAALIETAALPPAVPEGSLDRDMYP